VVAKAWIISIVVPKRPTIVAMEMMVERAIKFLSGQKIGWPVGGCPKVKGVG